MAKIHTKSIIISTLFFISVITTLWLSLSDEGRPFRKEESRIYLSIFKPDPKTQAFPNVITASKPATCNLTAQSHPDIPLPLVRSLLLVNNKNAQPVKLSMLKDIIPVLNWEETQKLNKTGILTNFNPMDKTLFYLSRAGFSQDKTQAIVCIENKSNRHNEGFVIQLRKIEGDWKIIKNTYIKFL